MKNKYKEANFALLIIIAFALFLFTNSVIMRNIDYASIFFEGILVFIPLASIYTIANLKTYNKKIYRLLFIGLFCICLSMITDTMDEFVQIKYFYTIYYEGLLQVAGFVFLLLGLKAWIEHNQFQQKKLEKIATTDFLTKIFNRRVFIKKLKYHIRLRRRYPNDLSIILFDIDHFKKVNDIYGHNTGDIVLKEMSKLVKNNIRDVDIFARYGGEEFVILLPNTSLNKASNAANKLCKLIASHSFGSLNTITSSFGVAQYKEDEPIDEFLKRVDEAMYEAKENGRNQIYTDISV